MSLFGASIDTLDDLFVHTLRTTYYAENRIVDALETMTDQATAPELAQALQDHRAESAEQARRLEEVFRMHGAQAKEASCPAFDGIKKANDSTASDCAEGPVRDAALAGGAQLVEHHEIAQYGKLVAWARALGRDDCASVLARSLEEEKATDQRLSDIAERLTNPAAARAVQAA